MRNRSHLLLIYVCLLLSNMGYDLAIVLVSLCLNNAMWMRGERRSRRIRIAAFVTLKRELMVVVHEMREIGVDNIIKIIEKGRINKIDLRCGRGHWTRVT